MTFYHFIGNIYYFKEVYLIFTIRYIKKKGLFNHYDMLSNGYTRNTITIGLMNHPSINSSTFMNEMQGKKDENLKFFNQLFH